MTEYSDWSECSVTCGKGLRMRTREYRMPQKAQMFNCNRQLISKEMCVAAVPECEGYVCFTHSSMILSKVSLYLEVTMWRNQKKN